MYLLLYIGHCHFDQKTAQTVATTHKQLQPQSVLSATLHEGKALATSSCSVLAEECNVFLTLDCPSEVLDGSDPAEEKPVHM